MAKRKEPLANIVPLCKECIEKVYPNTGKFKKGDVVLGRFVKKAYMDKGRIEHMWVIVRKVSKTGVRGVLDNQPVLVENLKLGDSVFIKYKDIEAVM